MIVAARTLVGAPAEDVRREPGARGRRRRLAAGPAGARAAAARGGAGAARAARRPDRAARARDAREPRPRRRPTCRRARRAARPPRRAAGPARCPTARCRPRAVARAARPARRSCRRSRAQHDAAPPPPAPTTAAPRRAAAPPAARPAVRLGAGRRRADAERHRLSVRVVPGGRPAQDHRALGRARAAGPPARGGVRDRARRPGRRTGHRQDIAATRTTISAALRAISEATPFPPAARRVPEAPCCASTWASTSPRIEADCMRLRRHARARARRSSLLVVARPVARDAAAARPRAGRSTCSSTSPAAARSKLNIAIPEFTVVAGADTAGTGKQLATRGRRRSHVLRPLQRGGGHRAPSPPTTPRRSSSRGPSSRRPAPTPACTDCWRCAATGSRSRCGSTTSPRPTTG